MYFIRNTIITLLLLTLAAIAVTGVMVEAPQVFHYTPARINALGRSVLAVMRPGYLLFIVWIVVILALLLVFLITVARPRRRMKIEVQMGGGRVVIMDAAIKKYIRNALAEMGDITVKKIDLREQRNLVTTDIYADVRTRENLPTLERRVISRVRTALAEDLGITNLGDVHVYIRNFEVTGRPVRPNTEAAPAAHESPASAAAPAATVAPTTAAAATATTPALSAEPEVSPLVVPTSDQAAPIITPDAIADAPVETASSDVEPVTLDSPFLSGSEGTDLTPHPDVDEPLPWGHDKADTERKDPLNP